MTKIGKAVRAARLAKGLTLADVADQVEGYDAGNLSRFERGTQSIDLVKLERVAAVLGVTVGSLYGHESAQASKDKGVINIEERRQDYQDKNIREAVRILMAAPSDARFACLRAIKDALHDYHSVHDAPGAKRGQRR